MKLHYSQTFRPIYLKQGRVSVPYEITLLSNLRFRRQVDRGVSVPYEITLLSNHQSPL